MKTLCPLLSLCSFAFICSSLPNVENIDADLTSWPTYDPIDRNHLEISNTGFKVGSNVGNKRCQLYTSLAQTLYKQCSSNTVTAPAPPCDPVAFSPHRNYGGHHHPHSPVDQKKKDEDSPLLRDCSYALILTSVLLLISLAVNAPTVIKLALARHAALMAAGHTSEKKKKQYKLLEADSEPC